MILLVCRQVTENPKNPKFLAHLILLVCRQVTVRLPPGYRPGAVMLEVLRGGFVSDPKPVLVLESAAAVADIERLDVAKHEGAQLSDARLVLQSSWCPSS